MSVFNTLVRSACLPRTKSCRFASARGFSSPKSANTRIPQLSSPSTPVAEQTSPHQAEKVVHVLVGEQRRNQDAAVCALLEHRVDVVGAANRDPHALQAIVDNPSLLPIPARLPAGQVLFDGGCDLRTTGTPHRDAHPVRDVLQGGFPFVFMMRIPSFGLVCAPHILV